MGKVMKQQRKKVDNLDAEFKKARQDVFKFGVKHLNQKDREATKYDQLVRLGAVPKKNRCINYKQLIENKKNERSKDLTSDETLKKHLAQDLKKQIDVAKSRIDKKINKKKKKNKKKKMKN